MMGDAADDLIEQGEIMELLQWEHARGRCGGVDNGCPVCSGICPDIGEIGEED